MSNDGSTDKKAGFGNPPTVTRFKKGKSGNPRGRPRKSQSMTAVAKRLFDTKVPVHAGGKTRDLPFFLALVHTLKVGALKGQAKPTRALSHLMESLGYFSEEADTEKQGVLVLSGIHPNEEEWLACVALDFMRKEKKRRTAMVHQTLDTKA